MKKANTMMKGNNTDYWKHFGLKNCPFHQASDPIDLSFFDSYFELIQHLILFNNVVIMVKGDLGTGKSTLLKQLPKKLGEDYLAVIVDGNELDSSSSLIHKIASSFNLNLTPGDQEEDAMLLDLLEQIQARKKNCTLLIDNSHKLSQKVIERVYQIVSLQNQNAYFHMVLSSDTENQQHIDELLSLGEEWLHFIDLLPLNLEQTKEYIYAKFQAQGYLNNFPLTPYQLNLVYKLSNGNLSKINQSVPQVLAKSTSKGNFAALQWIQKRPNIAFATALVVAFVGFISLQLKDNSEPSQTVTASLGLPAKNEMVVDKTPSAPLEENRLSLSEEQPSIDEQIKAIQASREQQQEQASQHALIDTVIAVPKVQRMTQPEPEERVQVSQLASLSDDALSTLQKPVEKKKVTPSRPMNKVVLKPKPQIEPLKHTVTNDAAPSSKNTSMTPLPSRQVTTKPPEVDKKTTTAKSQYTVQLIASGRLSAMKQFIAEHALEKTATVKKTYRHGRPWYILTWGKYVTLNDAKKAIATLSKDLKKYHPWAKRVSTIQRG